MNIKLIAPPYLYDEKKIIPYGMGIVNGFLKKDHNVEQCDLYFKVKQKGIDLSVFNNNSIIENYLMNNRNSSLLGSKIREILSCVSIKQNDLVCFSIHSYHQMMFALLLSKFLRNKKDNKIIMGGSYFTNAPVKYFIEQFSFIDIITQGPIDNNYDELLDMLKQNKRGIIYSKEKFNHLLHPDYDGINLNNYKYLSRKDKKLVLPIQTSMGCSNRCVFCNYMKIDTFHSPDAIIKEIKRLKQEYDTKYFYFINLSINDDIDFLKALCSKIIESGLDIIWASKSKGSGLSEEILLLMKKAGCHRLEIGLESASQNTLNIMNKHLDIEDFTRSIKFSHKIGIKLFIHIIVGFPNERYVDFMKTIEFMKKNGKYIDFFHINKFKLTTDSIVANNPIKYGIKINQKNQFINKIKRFEHFDYVHEFNLDKRIKLAIKVFFNTIVRKKIWYFKYMPFSIFYVLYYKNFIFKNTIHQYMSYVLCGIDQD